MRKIKETTVKKYDVVAVFYQIADFTNCIFGVVFNPNREGQMVICKHVTYMKGMIGGDTINVNLEMLEESGHVFLIGKFNQEKRAIENERKLKTKKLRRT